MISPFKLDDIDRGILRILQQRGDISMIELGEQVGLSHTPCWRRVKRLEDAGIIKQRVALLDPKLLELSVSVFAAISIKKHDEPSLARFEKAVQTIDEIVECHTVSGDRDFLLRVVVGTVADYELLLKRKLTQLPGVESVSSTFALKQAKYTTRLPI